MRDLPFIDDKGHCWHSTGITWLTSPPAYPVVCCHCGALGALYGSRQIVSGHGPHAREYSVAYDAVTKNYAGDERYAVACVPTAAKEQT